MPLTMLPLGKKAVINECRAKGKTKKFLEGLGIIVGAPVTVVADNGGNLIVNVKGTRLAINKGLAQQLLVQVQE